MGEESEALKSDIERRESMSGTIDAIEDRVVPSRIIERRRTAIKERVSDLKERVMGSAHSAGDRASASTDRMSDGASHAANAVTNAPEQVQRATAGSPLIAGAVAFGLGALVAVLLPETESEQRAVAAVQPQLAAATDAVKDVGQHALEHREVIRGGRRGGPQELGNRPCARDDGRGAGRRCAAQGHCAARVVDELTRGTMPPRCPSARFGHLGRLELHIGERCMPGEFRVKWNPDDARTPQTDE